MYLTDKQFSVDQHLNIIDAMRTYLLSQSSRYLDFTKLYKKHNIDLERFTATRALNKAIAINQPDLLIAEFQYGYGNNYAGINVSNIDVSLHTLRRYAPNAACIVLVEPREKEYVKKLEALFPIQSALLHPVTEADLERSILKL